MNESTNCVGGTIGTLLDEVLFGFFSTLLEPRVKIGGQQKRIDAK